MPSTFHSLIISKISINRSQCFISGMRNCTIGREQFWNFALFPNSEISALLKTSTFGKGWIATSYLHWDGWQSCKIGPPHKSTVEAGILDSFGNSSVSKETKLLTFSLLLLIWTKNLDFAYNQPIKRVLWSVKINTIRWGWEYRQQLKECRRTFDKWMQEMCSAWPTPPSVTRAETDPLDCKLQHNCNCTTWATQVIVWNILGT